MPFQPARVLRHLGIRLPIIQAPMAGVSTPTLAAAVSNPGGLGSIGIGASTPAAARQSIEEIQRLSDRSFNVNVFVHERLPADEESHTAWLKALSPAFEQFGSKPPSALREIYNTFADDHEMLEVLLDTRPPVVSFHFGLPGKSTIKQLKARGITLFASATSLAEARLVEASAVDVIVAQGYESGGHRGIFNPAGPDDKLSTTALVRLLVKSCSKPVIAAGGIMDGQGVNSVLALGAIAAQMGTAFVTTNESAADDAYRAAFSTNAAHHTIMTSVISGRPARSLANRFTKLGLDTLKIPSYPFTYDAGKALHLAAKARGEGGFGAQWAGQGAPLARSMAASQLMEELEREIGLGG